jgi:hypothetical protein
METIQNGNLILYSSLLVPGTTNKYGTANTNNTELTFTNINIKQILGSNYDRYQKFNLILNSIIIPVTTLAIPITNDANVMLYMSGLPFDNGSTYSAISGFSSNSSYIGCVHMVNASNANSAIVTYPPTFFNTIIKPQDINDITISLRGAIATLTATGATFLLPSGTIYPQMAFCFSIVPVLETLITQFPSQEDKTITYNQRLFK